MFYASHIALYLTTLVPGVYTGQTTFHFVCINEQRIYHASFPIYYQSLSCVSASVLEESSSIVTTVKLLAHR